MALITWQEKKETFNTEKNYFDITYEKVSRETSAEEDRLERLSNRLYAWGLLLGVLFSFIALFGCVALGALGLWLAFWIVFTVCIAGIIISLTVFLDKGQEYAIKLDKYIEEHDVWTTPEVKAIRQYNKEQQEIAAKWRAEHPLEEQIRACLLDPKSSVDVANLARYYAEVYLKENQNF